MSIKKLNKDSCTGCASCAAICPLDAIVLKVDENGFRKPVVDQIKCIECGLCEKICGEPVQYRKPKKVYIAKHKDEGIHKDSQSGGAFTAISDYILSQGGAVYGAIFNDNYQVVHVRATTPEMRNKMRGSKYIQSSIDGVYQEIENDLINGRFVLFAGTACQVAGVLRFLKVKNIDQTNLFTVDILCHGVPSLFIWRDTLRYLKSKYNADISSIQLKEMQEKSRPVLNIKLGETETTDFLYRKLYFSNLALRESCYSCNYKSTERVSDFTIGDAWGVKQANPEFYDRRGVSLVLINSEKALTIENTVLDDIVTQSVELDDYLQECMVSPPKPKREPEKFWKDYHKKKFEYIIETVSYTHLRAHET